MQAREFLSKLGDLNQTQIFAKIENVEVSCFLRNNNESYKFCHHLLHITVTTYTHGFDICWKSLVSRRNGSKEWLPEKDHL